MRVKIIIVFVFMVWLLEVRVGASIDSEPQTLPDRWRTEFVIEPVFNSKIRILQAGDVASPTVLLIHGLGQAGLRDWQNVIPALEVDYHVLAIDLPGFGQSEKPQGRYSPKNYAKLIDWLVKRYSDGPIDIVGHSMGGAIALRYAAEYPASVNKLILVDAAGILHRTAYLATSIRNSLDLADKPKRVQKWSSQVKDFGSALVERISMAPDPTKLLTASETAWNTFFKGKPNANAALALIGENFSTALDDLPITTTIIWGSKDKIAPLRTAYMLENRLPHARLKLIDGAGHKPMDSHTSIFNQLLKEVLAEGPFYRAELVVVKEDAGPEPILKCRKEVATQYSGYYASIDIKGCIGIRLVNLVTKHIRVEDSVVEMLNVRVVAEDVAIRAVESSITATNLSTSGKTGISANGSRFDIAGSSITGWRNAIKIQDRSRFVFSISDLKSDIYTGPIHGEFSEKKVKFDRVYKRLVGVQ